MQLEIWMRALEFPETTWVNLKQGGWWRSGLIIDWRLGLARVGPDVTCDRGTVILAQHQLLSLLSALNRPSLISPAGPCPIQHALTTPPITMTAVPGPL